MLLQADAAQFKPRFGELEPRWPVSIHRAPDTGYPGFDPRLLFNLAGFDVLDDAEPDQLGMQDDRAIGALRDFE